MAVALGGHVLASRYGGAALRALRSDPNPRSDDNRSLTVAALMPGADAMTTHVFFILSDFGKRSLAASRSVVRAAPAMQFRADLGHTEWPCPNVRNV